MTVFKTFFKVGEKSLINVFMYAIVFLVLVIALTKSNNGGNAESYMAESCKIAVFNHDNSELSKSLEKYLTAKHEVVELTEDLDSFRDSLYNREVNYILIIPEGYSENLASDTNQLLSYSLPGTITGEFIEMNINTFLSTYQTYKSLQFSDQEAYANTLSTLEKEVEANVYEKANTTESSTHMFYLYLPYAIISICIIGICPILIKFEELNLKRRTIISRVNNLQRIISLTLGSSIYTIVITCFFIVCSIFICGGAFWESTTIVRILNAFMFSFICLAIAFLLSNFTTNVGILNMFSNVIGLSSCFLCGIFVSRDLLSDTVLKIGRFLPAYWYVNIENTLEEKGVLLNSTISTSFLIQALYFVAIMVVAIAISQRKKSAS